MWVWSLGWVEKIPWRRKWQHIPYSCLGNPMDRGAWWVTVHGVAKSWTRLSNWTHTYTHTHTHTHTHTAETSVGPESWVWFYALLLSSLRTERGSTYWRKDLGLGLGDLFLVPDLPPNSLVWRWTSHFLPLTTLSHLYNESWSSSEALTFGFLIYQNFSNIVYICNFERLYGDLLFP